MTFHKKYTIICLLLLLIVCYQAASQLISDPDDRIYRYLSLWHERGYIKQLPIIRPYSLQVIEKLLQEVSIGGDPQSSSLAAKFLKEYIEPNFKISPDKAFPGPVHFGFEQKSLLNFDEYAGKNTIQFISTGFVTDIASYSGKISLGLLDNSDAMEIPKYTTFFDEAKTGDGVVETGDKNLGTGHYGTGGLFFGTEDLIFQAGMMRSSFGPFFDNGPVISPEAPAAGHFSFTYNASWFTFSSIFLDLFAHYAVDDITGDKVTLDSAEQKYMVVHNARFYFTDWFNLGIIQTNLCGGSFNPVFLIPLQHVFYTQQVFGNEGNTIIGLYSQFSFPFSIQFNTIFYVDDWDAFSGDDKTDFNGINFDAAQNKFALQSGLTWSPNFDIFKSMKFSYLMITPYMYTHLADADINYLTYTHDGENLGSILDPNSDQINFSIFLLPLSWLEIDLWTTFTRHGNASEEYGEGDGTVWDDGILSDGTVTFYGPSRFLTQDVIESVLQLGFNVDCYLDIPYVNAHIQAGYTYQYIWNKDLVKNEEEATHFLELMLLLEL